MKWAVELVNKSGMLTVCQLEAPDAYFAELKANELFPNCFRILNVSRVKGSENKEE